MFVVQFLSFKPNYLSSYSLVPPKLVVFTSNGTYVPSSGIVYAVVEAVTKQLIPRILHIDFVHGLLTS